MNEGEVERKGQREGGTETKIKQRIQTERDRLFQMFFSLVNNLDHNIIVGRFTQIYNARQIGPCASAARQLFLDTKMSAGCVE